MQTFHEAKPTHNLDGFVTDVPGSLRGKDLGDGGLNLVVSRAAIHVGTEHVGHGLGGIGLQGHLGKLLLDQPIVLDLLAELGAADMIAK